MRGIIRVGDATSHGGVVTTGSTTSQVMERPVARIGDLCICPIAGHQSCVIIEGDPDVIVDGKPAAFDGHKTSCGAALISSVPSSGRT
ncbi:PAAR domain-containing protein [Paraburkholderia megapolitana]|uniref:Zn-binding Pro-Ala-Ala-Arg (PAAR) domain-containing protein, incolved in TypeVI secretion n=1 Tax=Paraburkholderia megapolitana TaxID=420953 RepID=A0A1I3VCL0_9BURK|nr:PAAR domain-containing protein [Paraburkholderia megapolitana]QDQ85490.1 PAAR domain-containing protein [Paraburkholderia megapolitana]SFJ92952.1 Zn-binding Pro-Ala-Ala-Arg (PAAR) domain-containing protein, incolved in TypeVI secretion [Paraburkholderia megapolitana]